LAISCPSCSAADRSGFWSFADWRPGGTHCQILLGHQSNGHRIVPFFTDVRPADGGTGFRINGEPTEKEYFHCLSTNQRIHTQKKLFFIVKVESGPVAGMADLCPAGPVAVGADCETSRKVTFFSRF
jgi:hypothetical protein